MTTNLTVNPAPSPISIKVVTSTWAGYAHLDGTGYYFEMLRRIFPAPKWQLEVEFMPFARTLYLVEHNRVDLTLGVYRQDIQQGLLSQYPLEIDAIDAAVTPQLAATWQGVASLSHKKVLARLAYRYNVLTTVPMDYEEGSDMLTMLNSLNSGRIDAVLDYQAEMLALVPKLKKPQSFVIIKGVLNAEVFFAFASTDKGRMLKQHFDREHKRLIDSGEQARLFSKVTLSGN
ncbi:MAG: substrate-binding periplasmic protein [Shewanella sp.]